MSDEPNSEPRTVAVAGQDLDHSITKYRDYSESDKYSALAAFDMYGGNYHRTAIAYNVPVSTLRAWVKARAARGEGPSNLERERRGSLADKLESKVHDVVESITPEVIQKATLSQRGVFIGIGVDKLKVLFGQGIDPDPAAELCRLLNINRAQLPDRLELKPGDQIPAEFLQSLGHVIETKSNSEGQYVVENHPQRVDADATEGDARSLMDTDELGPVN
jgi:hypothetical protein